MNFIRKSNDFQAIVTAMEVLDPPVLLADSRNLPYFNFIKSQKFVDEKLFEYSDVSEV